ncbi:MAG: DUF1579 domain-containing protein [Verrucomicrobiota bacterium]|jgi:hypothetical protein
MKTNVYDDVAASTATSRPRGAEKSGSTDQDFDQEEIMKKLQAAGTPGAAHKALDAFAGNWKAEVKCWMEQDAQPIVTHGMARTGWILGGRFLEEEFRGEMMGQPFTGRCLLGFDNTQQKFKSVWVDDKNTAMVTSEGTADSGYKVITLEGRSDCPATGQKNISMKQVFRVHNPDEIVLEMFHDGAKRMEITYTRQ